MKIKTVDIHNDDMGPLPVEVVDHHEVAQYDVYACTWEDPDNNENDAFLLIHYKEIDIWVTSNDMVVTVVTEEE